jgi:DNA-binding NarL/FixJ family response regulator
LTWPGDSPALRTYDARHVEYCGISAGTVGPTAIIADDQPVVVASLEAVLVAAGVAVVGTAGSGREALALARELEPDVAIIDVAMPEPSGLAAVRDLREASPSTRTVLFGSWHERIPVEEACSAGAQAYVLKESPLSDVLRGVRAALDGRLYLDGALAGLVVAERSRALTRRERDVLGLLAAGLRNDEIGRRLYLSPQTVKVHLARATRRLGAATRTQAVVRALQLSLITYPDVPSTGE